MRRPAKLLALLLLFWAVSLMLPTAVGAQPRLLESTPRQDARLGRPPQTMRLCFSEPIARANPNDYGLTLTHAGGASVPLSVRPTADGTCLEAQAAWPQEATGAYTLFWRVRQEQGGQSLSGSLSFTIAPPSRPDVLRLSLLTAAAVGGAAVLGVLLTLFRYSVGFEPHRPQAEAESESLAGHH
jgi:methionine-rich copper-binding protein CopC